MAAKFAQPAPRPSAISSDMALIFTTKRQEVIVHGAKAQPRFAANATRWKWSTVFDRYNWDAGKSVKILGVEVTDEFMGTFQKQGLAQEFDMNGSVKKTI